MTFDSASATKRSLAIETIVIPATVGSDFEIELPAPATFRHATARLQQIKGRVQRISGAPAAKREVLALVLVFECDPDAAPIKRRYYALLFGSTMEGEVVAEAMFAGVAALPNGAPIAIYELPMRPPAKLELPHTLVTA